MSGLVAVVSLTRDAAAAQLGARGLASSYALLREQLTEVAVGDSCPVQGAASGADVQVSPDAAGWTAVHGRAHGTLARPVTAGDVPALDGQVCLVSHDPATGRTVVATDRMGFAPVYVAEQAGLLYVSTSALALAHHLGAPADHDAVRNFLVSGYQFGAETHWTGVRRLEPGTLLEVRGSVVRTLRYWQPTVDPAVEAMSLEAAAKHLVDVAVATYAERLTGQETYVDLTGGYDSRLLALLLDRAGVAFTGHVRETAVTPDVVLSQELARVAGWPWEPMLAPDDWVERVPGAARTALAAGDGRLEVTELARVVWWHQQLARTRPSLLSAGGGEHLQYYAWSTELPFPGRKQVNLERWVDMIALKPTDLAVLAPGSREATRTAYVDRFADWLEPFSDEPSTRQLDLAYAYKSGGHFGAYRAADDLVIDAQLPYYFEPVFSSAYSVRARHRGGFRLMRAMMHRLDPAVAAVETTRGGPALPMRPSTLHRYLPYYRVLLRKGVNKAAGQVGVRPLFLTDDAPAQVEADARAAVVDDLQRRGTLDWDHARVRPLLSDEGVRRLRSGEAGASMLGRVVTAEMALAASGATS